MVLFDSIICKGLLSPLRAGEHRTSLRIIDFDLVSDPKIGTARVFP